MSDSAIDSDTLGRVVAFPPEFHDVVKLTRLSAYLGRPFFRRFAEQYSLTLNEWRVIVMVAQTPGVAAQEISDRVGLNAMNVSRAVAALRSAGRVRARRDPENHRRQMLFLTEEGWRLFDELYPSAEAQSIGLFAVLGEEERVTLAGMLDRLLEHCEQVIDQAGSGDETEPAQ